MVRQLVTRLALAGALLGGSLVLAVPPAWAQAAGQAPVSQTPAGLANAPIPQGTVPDGLLMRVGPPYDPTAVGIPAGIPQEITQGQRAELGTLSTLAPAYRMASSPR